MIYKRKKALNLIASMIIALALVLVSFSAVFAIERTSGSTDRHDYRASNGYVMIGTHPHGEADGNAIDEYSSDIGFPNAVMENGAHKTEIRDGKTVDAITNLSYFYHEIDCVHYYDITMSIKEIRESEDVINDIIEAAFDREDSFFNRKQILNPETGKGEYEPKGLYEIGKDFTVELPEMFGSATGEFDVVVVRPEVKEFSNGIKSKGTIDIPEYRFSIKVVVTDEEGVLEAEAEEARIKAEKEAEEARIKAEEEAKEAAARKRAEEEARRKAENEAAKTAAEAEVVIEYIDNYVEEDLDDPPEIGRPAYQRPRGNDSSNTSQAFAPVTEAEPTFVPREFFVEEQSLDGAINGVVREGTVSLNTTDSTVTTLDGPTAGANEMIITGQVAGATGDDSMSAFEKFAVVTTAIALAASIALLATIISDIKILIWYAARRR